MHLFRLAVLVGLFSTSCIQPPPSVPVDGTRTPTDAADQASTAPDASTSDDVARQPNRSQDTGGSDSRRDASASTEPDQGGPDQGEPDLREPDLGEPRTATLDFQDGADYAGTSDTELIESSATSNFAEDVDMEVKGAAGQHVLIRWDISSIPTDAVVEDAFIVLTSTDNSSGSEHDVHPVTVEWSETEATWNQRLDGVEWTQSGCQDDADRSPDSLGSFEAPGPNTVMQVGPNPDLVAQVQKWVEDPSSNHGVVLQRPGAGDGLHLFSSEADTRSVRPRLTVQFTVVR